MIVANIPIKAVSVANLREHWAQRAKRAKLHRTSARIALHPFAVPINAVRVRLVRMAPRELDGDNLQSSLKACRDGVADWLGVADNDPRVSWEYAQERGKPKTYAVRVEVS